jgi:hypothetical protein
VRGVRAKTILVDDGLWLRCTVQLIPYLEEIFPRMGGYIPTWSETLSAQCGEHDGKGTNGVTAVTLEAVLRAHYLRDKTRR